MRQQIDGSREGKKRGVHGSSDCVSRYKVMGGWGKEKSAKKTKNSFYLPFIFSHFFFHASRVKFIKQFFVKQITNNHWYILSESRSLPVVNF